MAIIVQPLLKQVEEEGIKPEIEKVGELAQFTSNFPYYKYLAHNLHLMILW